MATNLSELLSAHPALAFVILSSVLINLLVWKAIPTTLPGIPHRGSRSRWFGDLRGLIKHRSTYGTTIPWMTEQCQQFKTPILQLSILPFQKYPIVIVNDFRETEDVATRRQGEFDVSPITLAMLRTVIPNGTPAMFSHERFKAQRRLWAGTMSTDFLRHVAAHQVFNSGKELVRLWRWKTKLCRNAPFQADANLRHCALDAIWAAAVGSELGGLPSQLDAITTSRMISAPRNDDGVALLPEGEVPPLYWAIDTILTATTNVQLTPFPQLIHSIQSTFPRNKRARKMKDETMLSLLNESRRKYAGGNVQDLQPNCAMEQVLYRETAMLEKGGPIESGSDQAMVDELSVIRPVVVSIGLGVAVLLTCKFIAKPATLWFNSVVKTEQGWPVPRDHGSTYAMVFIHTAILLSLVTGATYAGTSNLFAAYLAGASISWWDSEFLEATPHVAPATSPGDGNRAHTENQDAAPSTLASPDIVDEPALASSVMIVPIHAPTSGVKTFERFYGPVLHRVFKPLFFASIGFAIPITKLFSGPIIWRGIIYTILMLFAKFVTGLWLVRFSGPLFHNFLIKFKIKDQIISSKAAKNKTKKNLDKNFKKTATTRAEGVGTRNGGIQLQDLFDHTPETSGTPLTPANANEGRKRAQSVKVEHINRPLSLYPAAMLGTAMTARGEIGFLIASLAETTGVFASTTSTESSQSSEIYLITTWAVMLCTIIGPLSVGTLVKRVRRLDQDLAAKGGNGRGEGPLGIWGVS